MSVRKVYGKNAEKLSDKKVLIIGIGGLGCMVSNLLARMKIPLILVDNDIVDNTNLERQILFDKDDLLKSKVAAAKNKLEQFTKITTFNDAISKENIQNIIPKDIDLVIDCTDNIESRLLINNYCKKHKINWIYSGAVSNIGTIYFVNSKKVNTPCYECINETKDGETSCNIGVLNSIVATVSAMTVNIAINYLVNNIIDDQLIRINFGSNEVIKLKVKKNKNCKSCKGQYLYL